MNTKKFALCGCGCGMVLNGQRSQKFYSAACRQRTYRQRHPPENDKLCNNDNRKECNKSGTFGVVVLFDETNASREFQFVDLYKAWDFVKVQSFGLPAGYYWRVFEPSGHIGFCDGFLE